MKPPTRHIAHASPAPRKDRDLIDRLTTRAVEHIYPSAQELKKMLLSGRRLNVYQGFDPTADTLHIGHTVGMRKLRDFQLLGHNVTFLIGDFTGRVGDPTDKSAARKQLTKEEVEHNLKSFKQQASAILDFDDKANPVTIRYNSHWHEKLNFADILELASLFTVQQMIKRDMFQTRLKEDRPIYIHEFMYPLMQAYDSIMMDIDVEVGGNDQVFNMLCGRDLTRERLHKEKVVLAVKLLVDPAGSKMGKSEGNMVMMSDSPENMYGKFMSFPDELIVPGFEILTDLPIPEIKDMKAQVDNGALNPMDAKKKLASTIVDDLKGSNDAKRAQTHFESVFQSKSAFKAKSPGSVKNTDILPKVSVKAKTVPILELLTTHTGIAASNSKAKRLIEQGAVVIGNKKQSDKQATIEIPSQGIAVKTGKKAFLVINSAAILKRPIRKI